MSQALFQRNLFMTTVAGSLLVRCCPSFEGQCGVTLEEASLGFDDY
jgi:hypothetical protein